MEHATSTTPTVVITRCHGPTLVVPGHLLIGPGEQVAFQTIGTGPVILLFPTLLFLDERGEEAGRVELLGDDKAEYAARVLSVKPEARPGLHPYAAYCTEICRFAVGGSHPKMIVKR